MTDAREQSLLNLLNQIAAEQKYENPEIKTSVVETTGSNFTSQLFHVTIKATNKEDLNIFAKVAVMGETMRELLGNLFNTERYFYDKLARTFKEIEDKHNVPKEHRLFVPKFYGYSNNHMKEVIALQDLSKDGFETFERLKSVDWDSASKAVGELAKLHALSIAYQKYYPKDYAETAKLLKPTEEGGIWVPVFESAMKRLVQMTREKNKPKVQKFFDTFSVDNFINLYGPKKRPVIIHNDYRTSNLMCKNENGKLQVAIMDYQTLNPGSFALDLLYFIFTGTDGAFRAQYYDQLIEHYYENMAAVLRRVNLDVAEEFPRNIFDEELKDALPFGVISASIALPIITIDLDNVVTTDTGGFDTEVMFAMADKSGDAGSLCAQRLNEVVDDYVKLGVF